MRKPLTSTVTITGSKPVTSNNGEYTNFTNLLDKLLSVPHSKIKAELESEKKRPHKPRDRATRRHAYRDATDVG
jgi:hypothetical protein